MTQYGAIKVFEHKRIRSSWDAETETWYYSIVDVVGILTDQPDTRHASNYWKVLKNRLAKEGCELVTNCNQLKMQSADGKYYKTDVANQADLHFEYGKSQRCDDSRRCSAV